MNTLFSNAPDDEDASPSATRTGTAPAEEDEGTLFSSVRRGDSVAQRAGSGSDKEITLGTMTVLGLFFALAVLCAGFFGFGYSAGSRHTVHPAAMTPSVADGVAVPGCKPAPGSPAAAAAAIAANATPVNVPYTPPAPVKPAAAARTLPDSTPDAPVPAPVPEHAAARTPPSAVAAAPAVTPSAETTTQTWVQVAALSHQADAELVATTLKGRGYNVSIHTSPNDKLLHVQLGPFATRKEADTMRQRLLTDGFNAILK